MAADHILGLNDLIPTTAMVVAILALSAIPMYAQSQQLETTNAKNLFKIITSDKLKIQTFCKIADLGDQLNQADRVHDTNKIEEVSQKLDELEGKLPEYTALVALLADGP